MTGFTYGADSENGEHIDDPTEDDIYMVVDDLNTTDNTFVVIQPYGDDSAWYVSVLRRDTGYEVVRRDNRSREEDVTTRETISGIASDLIVWLKARNVPLRLTRR